MTLPTDLIRKIAQARADRTRIQGYVNEYLRLADPTRPRIGDDLRSPAVDRQNEADDRFDTTMEEVAEDFASDLIGRLMPRAADWLKYEAEEGLPEEVMNVIADQMAARTKAIFAAIRQSNLYDEAIGEWALDQGHGTSGIYIVDPGSAQPFYSEAIPPGQLLISRGARGVSFKARECAWEIGDAVAYWPKYEWTAQQKRDAADKTKRAVKITLIESATRIPDPGTERWLWRVSDNNKVLYEEEVKGRGCCPIIVSRWRTHATSAWGIGPLRKAVPDARTLDQINYLLLKNAGKTIDPVVSYEEDGLINVEGGVTAGMWIPRTSGSKAPEAIETGARLDLAYFEESGLQDNVRRAGYQEGPRQKGKTPPTASQWMDEKGDQGRRLEMPTGKLYAEGVIAIAERFEYLLEKAGKITAGGIEVKNRGLVKIRPLNPLARQQDFEKVQTATTLLTQGNAIWGPQIMGATIDGPATFLNLKKAMNDELIVVQKPEQAQALLQGVLGAQQPQDGAAPPDPAAAPQQ